MLDSKFLNSEVEKHSMKLTPETTHENFSQVIVNMHSRVKLTKHGIVLCASTNLHSTVPDTSIHYIACSGYSGHSSTESQVVRPTSQQHNIFKAITKYNTCSQQYLVDKTAVLKGFPSQLPCNDWRPFLPDPFGS